MNTNKKSSRILATIIIFALIVSTLPTTFMSAVAESSTPKSGYDAESNTYYITDITTFNEFCTVVRGNTATKITEYNAVFYEDIDLNPGFEFYEDGTFSGDGTPVKWTPLSYYRGTINGNNHTISGLYCQVQNNAGFIGTSKNVTINNLGLTNGYIESIGNDAGAFCGNNGNNGTLSISDCYNNVTVKAGKFAGGFVGNTLQATTLNVTNSYNFGNVTSSGVGDSSSAAAGILGKSYKNDNNCTIKVTNTYNTGKITSDYFAGGIIGDTSGVIILTDTYNEGTITGSSNSIGGIAGNAIGSDVKIQNCHNIGSVTGNEYVSGILGRTTTNTVITNCYNTGAITGVKEIGGILGYYSATVGIDNCYNEGELSGTSHIGGIVGYSGSTSSNLNLKSCNNSGTLISTTGYIGGLAGYVHTATVEKSYNSGNVSGNAYVGGLVGNSLKNTAIKTSYNAGSATATSTTSKCGGLVGNTNSIVTVDDSYNTGNISGKQKIGGLVGDLVAGANVTVNNCYNTGNVTATSYSGGFVGFTTNNNTEITITDSFSAGKITANYSGSDPTKQNAAAIVGGIGTTTPVTKLYIITTTDVYYLSTTAYRGILGKNDSDYGITSLLASNMIDGDAITSSEKMSGLSDEHWYAIPSDEPLDISTSQTAGTVITTKNGTGYLPQLLAFKNVTSPILIDVDEASNVKTNAIMAYSASVLGDITFSMHFSFSDEILSDNNAKIVLSVPNSDNTKRPIIDHFDTETIYVKDMLRDDNGFYIASCSMAAKEMSQPVTAKLYDGNNTQLNIYKGMAELTEVSTSVMEYANSLISTNTTSEKNIRIAKAMLNYGGYSQVYFEYHTENLANKDIDKTISSYSGSVKSEIDSYALSLDGTSDDVIYYGTRFDLESDLIVKHYFNVALDVSINNIRFIVDGTMLTPPMDGTLRRIDVASSVKNLNKTVTIQADSLTLKYSPMSYIQSAFSAKNNSVVNIDALRNMCLALYDFYKAANS